MKKKFKKFLETKGYTQNEFEALSNDEQLKLIGEYNDAQAKIVEDKLNELSDEKASKEDVEKIKNELKEILAEQGDALTELKTSLPIDGFNPEKEVNKFIEDNIDKIKEIKSSGHGVIEMTVKAPASMTTGSGVNTNPPNLTGTQQAPLTDVNLRAAYILGLTSNVNTSLAAYPYTEAKPKDGDYSFIGEGAEAPQIDFTYETNYAKPKKAAAYIRLTDESIQDVAGLQSLANGLLRKKHALKKQNGVLFGDGLSENPKGATTYARSFVAGDMALAVTNPNIMDVINAIITDVYTTHNFVDEESYMPNLVMVNPIDFFLHFTAKKDGDGKPLYPTASVFSMVNVGGVTIIPERSIPSGNIFCGDLSQYNTTNYHEYTVKIGFVNDDFIKGQFVIVGQSRFHAFVKKLDEQAFVYDSIATIKTAITAV